METLSLWEINTSYMQITNIGCNYPVCLFYQPTSGKQIFLCFQNLAIKHRELVKSVPVSLSCLTSVYVFTVN